jgi:chitin synthase
MELAGTLVLPAAIVFTLYIIILTIIPGTVKPVVSLILLAIILGIPALLIVMTSRRFAYLGWMLIYLFSLPIWNFVLPAYAFLHMVRSLSHVSCAELIFTTTEQDDFTWGETRKIVGGKDGGHGDQDDAGLFDSSSIVMRRWVDFERDRRYKSGIQSRDSTYDVLYRSGSPGRSGSTRNSVVSSVDTYLSGGAASSLPGEALFRQSSPGVSAGSINASDSDGHISSSAKFPSHIELPAPLAKTAYDNNSNFAMPRQSSAYDFPRYEDDSEEEREGILARNNGSSKSWTHLDTQSSVSSSPFHSSSSDNRSEFFANYRDESVIPPVPRLPTPSAAQRHSRGISLIDPGPVAGSEGGMRSVQRQTRRASSSRPRQQSTNSSSNTHTPSQSFSSPISPTLPPGASPARRT